MYGFLSSVTINHNIIKVTCFCCLIPLTQLSDERTYGYLAEWLRRKTRKFSWDLLGYSRIGSNPVVVAVSFCTRGKNYYVGWVFFFVASQQKRREGVAKTLFLLLANLHFYTAINIYAGRSWCSNVCVYLFCSKLQYLQVLPTYDLDNPKFWYYTCNKYNNDPSSRTSRWLLVICYFLSLSLSLFLYLLPWYQKYRKYLSLSHTTT